MTKKEWLAYLQKSIDEFDWDAAFNDADWRNWRKLIQGVRVEGDTVVVKVKGGNDAARQLCGALIKEMNK
jgi:hypothetical protein